MEPVKREEKRPELNVLKKAKKGRRIKADLQAEEVDQAKKIL